LSLADIGKSDYVWVMSTVEQIEQAIQKLPREEFFRLHEWIRDRFDDEWDKQMEEDARSGRLDRVAQEAIAEYRAGKTLPFPPNEK
jgi:hypothetical protein